jgi:hypothetical protein
MSSKEIKENGANWILFTGSTNRIPFTGSIESSPATANLSFK